MNRPWARPLAFTALCSLALVSCKERNPPPAPPPGLSAPAGSAAPKAACASGGGTLADASLSAVFPRTVGGYCVDPNGETRMFGEGSPKGIDAVCTEAFNGDCELYKSFGLKSVTTFRYVDGAGGNGSVEVIVSRMGSPDGAYGMFTKRVVSDNDPAADKFPRDMKLPGASAQGTGTANLCKGQLFVELTYTNDTESPKQVAESSARILSVLAREVAAKLPGAPTLPASAAALPEDKRLPLGIVYEPKNAFELTGAIAGATGFYKDGDRRYRVLSITRADADQAKDALQTIGKRKGAAKENNLGEGAYRLLTEGSDEPRTEWIVARSGKQLFGVGDEPLVLKAEMSAAERDKVGLTRDQKLALLKGLLQAK